MEVVYTITNQYIFDTDNFDCDVEDLLSMSETKLIELMTDQVYNGIIENNHCKIQFELLDDEGESLKSFESIEE